MNDRTIYRPYKAYIYFLPFTVLIGIFSFMLAGFSITNGGTTTFASIIFGTLSVCISKIFIDAASLIFLFDRDGVYIAGNRHKNDNFYSWGDISYAYYVRNYRGFCFLVLSQKRLSCKDAKHLVRKSINPARTHLDHALVIYIDHLQDVSRVKEFINNHVLDAETY